MKTFMRLFILLTICSIAVPCYTTIIQHRRTGGATFTGTAYYVAQTATGDGDGSTDSDRMSVATHNASTFEPGDMIYLRGTITSEVTIPSSGTADAHIIYDGNLGVTYDSIGTAGATGPATIDRGWDGTDRTITGRIGIYTGSTIKHYITIRNLRVTRCNTGMAFRFYTKTGYLTPSTHITVENCYLYDLPSVGIDFMWASNVTIGGASGKGNFFYNCADVYNLTNSYEKVIGASGHDFIISYNKFDSSTDRYANTDPIACAGWHSYNGLIEYNSFDHVREENSIDLKDGTHHVVVRFNKFNNHYERYGLGNIHLNNLSHHCVVYGNYFANGNRSVLDVNRDSHDHHIFSNVFDTNSGRAVSSYRSSDATINMDNIFVYNNTVYRCTGNLVVGLYLVNPVDSGSYQVKNNVLVGNEYGASRRQIWAWSTSAANITHNHYYYDATNLPLFYDGATKIFDQWKAAGFDTTGSAITDPLLDANFHLQTGSPCIGTGTAISDAALPVITVQGETIVFSYADALDPEVTDFSTFPPTVGILDRDTVGWDKGAFAYVAP